MKHLMTVGFLAMCVSVAVAAPTITIDRVQQRYPWNGIVDIDYTVSGLSETSDPNDYALSLTATDAESGRSTVASNFLVYAACDLPTAGGAHRVSWDAAADGFKVLSARVKVTASLLQAPVTVAGADYVIVDVSGGRAASSYPVRFVSAPGLSSATFNRDLYKTTRVVLKKVPAGEFWMGEGTTTANSHLGDVGDWDGVSRHCVQISHDYHLGLFPVTIAQYTNVVTHSLMSSQDVPTSPITGLWWYETEDLSTLPFFSALLAKAKCRGEAVGGFTLPTESQLEYATRAGTTTCYYNGWSYLASTATEGYNSGGRDFRNMLRTYCLSWQSFIEHKGADWTGDVYPELGRLSGLQFEEVGFYPANPWGFYDFFGNGYQWCLDWYGDYPVGTMGSPAKDPTGPSVKPSGVGRCFRGSTYEDKGSKISCGMRSPETNKTSTNAWRHGFRLALTVPTAE